MNARPPATPRALQLGDRPLPGTIVSARSDLHRIQLEPPNEDGHGRPGRAQPARGDVVLLQFRQHGRHVTIAPTDDAR